MNYLVPASLTEENWSAAVAAKLAEIQQIGTADAELLSIWVWSPGQTYRRIEWVSDQWRIRVALGYGDHRCHTPWPQRMWDSMTEARSKSSWIQSGLPFDSPHRDDERAFLVCNSIVAAVGALFYPPGMEHVAQRMCRTADEMRGVLALAKGSEMVNEYVRTLGPNWTGTWQDLLTTANGLCGPTSTAH